MAAFVFTALLLATVSVLKGRLKRFFFGAGKEGSVMGEGRHRATTEEDPYQELRAIENMEPWKVTHHLYQPLSFDSADDVAVFLASADRPGRRIDWRVWVPQTARWKHSIKETVSEEEFMDFYLDSIAEKLRG